MLELTETQISTFRASEYFDPEWYRNTYPDVDSLDMDPAVHYLRYGQHMDRDPGPDFSTKFVRLAYRISNKFEPVSKLHWMRAKHGAEVAPDYRVVLKAAGLVAQGGDHKRAIKLAADGLPDNLAYTASILRANAAINDGDLHLWQQHVNAYLAAFDTAPISLKGTGTIFERLATADLPPVTGGPLISVIMPAWNAENTVRKAAQSILNQTWRNLELLIVDDCSSDATWSELRAIASADSRVKILRNNINVGPYVSKNRALDMASGFYVTGHDADDWAHPQRLATHVAHASERKLDASLGYMIRMQPRGTFAHLGNVGSFSVDGVARKASISCLFKRSVLREKLGYWDSVRFGADSELIERATRCLGEGFAALPLITMICLDLETSLTNHRTHGVDKAKGISPIRAEYRDGWTAWLKANTDETSYFLPFPQKMRRYPAAQEMIVSHEDVLQVAELSMV